jgi:hypothetical protein
VSPIQRSLKKLRAEGWTAEVVQYWNTFGQCSVDLINCIDILCFAPGRGFLGVQVCKEDVSVHIKKIQKEPRSIIWRQAGGLLVIHAWRLRGARGDKKTWQCRIIKFKP